MGAINEGLDLLKPQAAIEFGLRQPGEIRITEERKLYALRERLQQYSQAVPSILQTARNLNRTLHAVGPKDVGILA